MGKNVWVSLAIPPEYRNTLDEINKQIKTVLGERYDTMDHDMYHMTTLFLGDKFKDFKKLEQTLNEYNYSEYALEFDQIVMFPPDKKNLLVIKFKQNSKLKNDVIIMKKVIENNDPVEDFLPHITLGKLRTTKGNKATTKEEKEFSQLVETIIGKINQSNNTHNLHKLYNFTGRGFYLCGMQ